MNLPVSLQSLADYDPERVKDSLHLLLEPLGGIDTYVKPGQKVLIKPNLLSGKAPEKAVTTHPEIVRQVILLAQSAGGIVSVGDSPGIGKPESVARKCGVLEVIEETGARFAPLDESVPISLKAGTFHHLEVAKESFLFGLPFLAHREPDIRVDDIGVLGCGSRIGSEADVRGVESVHEFPRRHARRGSGDDEIKTKVFGGPHP